MYKHLITGVVASLLSAHAAHAVDVGGRTYEDVASVNALLGAHGSFATSGDPLEEVLTDLDPGTYATASTSGGHVDVGWVGVGNAYNGEGTDIDLYDLGSPDSFIVTINGVSNTYLSVDTGYSAAGKALNRVSIELSDFGLGYLADVYSLRIGMYLIGDSGTVPSLSFVAGTNFVIPEPSTYALMVGGLALLAAAAHRRRAG